MSPNEKVTPTKEGMSRAEAYATNMLGIKAVGSRRCRMTVRKQWEKKCAKYHTTKGKKNLTVKTP